MNNPRDTETLDTNLEFSLESIRLSQNFADDIAVKRKITVVPCTKPHSSWWVRVQSEPENQIETMCLEDRDDNQLYLVMPGVRQQLSDEGRNYRLSMAMNRQGNIFIWPMKLPNTEIIVDRMDRYYQSVRAALSLAKLEWVRVKWNKGLGAYDTLKTERKLPEPEWPEESFQEIVNLAFKNLTIGSMDHPLVQRLLHGE